VITIRRVVLAAEDRETESSEKTFMIVSARTTRGQDGEVLRLLTRIDRHGVRDDDAVMSSAPARWLSPSRSGVVRT
jgi:hypothetical protein